MKTRKRSAALAIIIVLSVSVAAAAVTNKDILTATGQDILDPYAALAPSPTGTSLSPSSSSSGVVDPPTLVDTAVLSPGGTAHYAVTGLQVFEANGWKTYESQGFRLALNTGTGVWHLEWDVKNNLGVPATVTPSAQFYGCEARRAGSELPSARVALYAGASQSCPARGLSVNTGSSLTSAQPSAVDRTHDSTVVRMSFAASTIIGQSVKNTFLKLHPEATNVRPAANPAQLRASVCSVDTLLYIINGNPTTLQPGQSATISSTVDSRGLGVAASPANHALINYNVKAGGSTYKAYKADSLIVFNPEESTVLGSGS